MSTSKSKTVVMLFEDDADLRRTLEEALATTDRHVVTPPSAPLALRAVQEDPEEFDVILIGRHFRDAEVVSNADIPEAAEIFASGDDLAIAIERINPTIPIIRYTTRKDFMATSAEAQARGVVYRAQVADLVDELRKRLTALGTIFDRLGQIQLTRRTMGLVVAGLGIGFQLVDTYGRIWFRDEAFLRTVGDSGLTSNICYCRSHGYPLSRGRCKNCLMNRLLGKTRPPAPAGRGAGQIGADGAGDDDDSLFQIYYTPTYPNGPRTGPVFQYLNVLATPVWSPPVEPDGKVELIGVVEAVSRIPACISSTMDSLGLKDHLGILASALEDIGIGRVRVYRVGPMPDATIGPLAMHGLICRGPMKDAVDFSKVVLPFKKDPQFAPGERLALTKVIVLDDHVGLTDKLRVDLRILDGHDPVGVALFDIRGRLIAVVAMDNGVSETADASRQPPLTAAGLRPAACGDVHPPAVLSIIEEMARVMASKPFVAQGEQARDDKSRAQHIFQGIRMRIAANVEADAGNTLQRILTQVRRRIPAIAMAHVRRLEGDAAISTARVGEYGGIADQRVNVRTSQRMTAKVARTGLPKYVDDIVELDPLPGQDEFTPEQCEMMFAYPSHAVYPLLAEGQVIGTVSFQSPLAAFFRGDRQYLCEMVAGLLARGLRDVIAARHEADRADAQAARADALELGTRAALLVLHNISRPMNDIRKCVEAVKRDLVDRPGQRSGVEQALTRIDQGCDHITGIQDDLLRLVDVGTSDLEDIDLHELIRAVCRDTAGDVLCGGPAHRGGVPKAVRANRSALTVALTVLIGNAADALSEGQADGYIEITLRRPDKTSHIEARFPASCVVIDVVDNGPGIAEEIREKLFEPWHSTKPAGFGIGLAYARRLIRARGGEIYWAQSDRGPTRFAVILPVEEVDADKSEPVGNA